MTYEYKFLRFGSKRNPPEIIQDALNKLGAEGWKVLSFYPTSDAEIGRSTFYAAVPNDLGYVFLLMREVS